MLEITDDQGQPARYVTATEAGEWLGEDVTRDMVYKWQKRRLITGYQVGKQVFYRLDELREVEQATRTAKPGRPRRDA